MRITRREWLASSLGGWPALSARGVEPLGDPADDALDREINAVRALGRLGGLSRFAMALSPHFLAIGNARRPFLAVCLAKCEALRAAFLAHFRHKGFSLSGPGRRLTIVALADADSLAALPKRPRELCYGAYSVSTNRLVIQDLATLRRPVGRPGIAPVASLLHEATHQLSFNSSLLSRERVYPTAIVEGLAMYGESFGTAGSRFGGVNHPVVSALVLRLKQGKPWVDLGRLLFDERLFWAGLSNDESSLVPEPETYNVYAESWLLIHYLLTSPALLPRFRAYLASLGLMAGDEATEAEELEAMNELGIPRVELRRLDPAELARSRRNLALARKHLGDLRHLDQGLRRHLRNFPYRTWSTS